MSLSNLLLICIVGYFLIRWAIGTWSQPEQMTVGPGSEDPQLLDDILELLQQQASQQPTITAQDQTQGVELTLPKLSEPVLLYPTIMDSAQHREAELIIEYVTQNFNQRLATSLPTTHTFRPGRISTLSYQNSPQGKIYKLRFPVTDSTSNITLELNGEVVKLPESYYLNYVEITGGDSPHFFKLTGPD